jgi:tetratricopeptide (TPR) repeat protein
MVLCQDEYVYQFHKGFYVDTAGVKHNGFIEIKNGNKINYMPFTNTKEQKIRLKEVEYISINSRNFVVLHNVSVRAEMGISNEKFKHVLSEEIIFGKIRLFKTNIVTSIHNQIELGVVISIGPLTYTKNLTSTGPAKHGEEFYFAKKDSEKEVQIKTGDKKFRGQMKLLIKDNEKCLKSIDLEQKNYYNLFEIIKYYNSEYDTENPYLETVELNLEITDSVYSEPNQLPKFIGGKSELLKLISDIEQPLYAKQNRIYGSVLTELILNKDGKVVQVKAIEKIGFGCDEKAVSIMERTQNTWIPAQNNGENVFSSIIIPVYFKPSNDGLDDKAKSYFKKGLKLYKNKSYKNAVTFFETATSINNNYIDAIYYRGSSYYQLGRKIESCKYLKKAFDLGLTGKDRAPVLAICDSNSTIESIKKLTVIDSTLYKKGFKYQDGAFSSFTEFKFNSPSITLKKVDSSKDEALGNIDSKTIYYLNEKKLEQKLKKREVWGYCLDGEVYVFTSKIIGFIKSLNESGYGVGIFSSRKVFLKIKSFGMLMITEAVEKQSYSYNDPNIGGTQTNTSYVVEDPIIIDYSDGKMYKNTVENFSHLLLKDSQLHKEYSLVQPKKKQKHMMFMFRKRFNERNPIYIYNSTYK